MKKILIYEPNSSQALAIAKYIKKYSNYYIVGVLEEKIFFNKKNYDEIIIKNFIDIEIDKYDYVFPMGANSTYKIVNKYKKLYYKNEILFSYENLIAYDKPKMLNIAKALDIPIPKTFYEKEEIINFPIFYKETFENGGGVRGVAKNINEIPNYNNLIYQEYIDTPATYGVGFLAKNGEVVTYKQHKEVISYPKEGGSAIVIENFNDDRLFQYTKKLLQELNYNGWGLAEFKYCKNRNDFVFMEINAKFWASIEFMLYNNNFLFKELLNIDYLPKKVDKIIFVNRYLNYNLINFIKNFKYFFYGKKIIENSLGIQLIRAIIPNKIIGILKKILK